MKKGLVNLQRYSASQHKVFNPGNYNCPISRIHNRLYSGSEFHKEFSIPSQMGKGYCRKYDLNESVEILISDMTFHKSFTMGTTEQKECQYGLGFCLESPLFWSMANNKKDYELRHGESYIFCGSRGSNLCTYQSDERYYSVYIQYSPDLIMDMVQYLHNDSAESLLLAETGIGARRFSPGVNLVLNDIINCRYAGDVQRIYLEGKALELMAVYFDEVIFENGKLSADINLSSNDIKALRLAKEILDNNIVSSVTLKQLARLACLNEFKIKKGFKHLFGITVHAYIIDKRLELARFLLEDEKLSVVEAAARVGYSNTSHFTEKFRKKYGINPSKYVNRS